MKTHTQLGITFQELGALLGVRALLAEGYMHHSRNNNIASSDDRHLFNMSRPCLVNDHCGSIGCIGGTMALLMGKTAAANSFNNEAHEYVMKIMGQSDLSLEPLFYPPSVRPNGRDLSYNVITPKQAIAAIDNFLNTGKPMWEKVLGWEKPRAKRKVRKHK